MGGPAQSVAAYPVSFVPFGRALGANKAGSASSLFLCKLQPN